MKGNISKINMRDKAVTSIVNGILKFQQWFAFRLEFLTKSWKRRQQWILFFMICLAFGGMSTMVIIKSFKTLKASKIIIPKPISVPKMIYEEDKAFLITTKEFQKVAEYKSTHPNLMKERPGLYDSLSLIEQIYYSQQK